MKNKINIVLLHNDSKNSYVQEITTTLLNVCIISIGKRILRYVKSMSLNAQNDSNNEMQCSSQSRKRKLSAWQQENPEIQQQWHGGLRIKAYFLFIGLLIILTFLNISSLFTLSLSNEGTCYYSPNQGLFYSLIWKYLQFAFTEVTPTLLLLSASFFGLKKLNKYKMNEGIIEIKMQNHPVNNSSQIYIYNTSIETFERSSIVIKWMGRSCQWLKNFRRKSNQNYSHL